MIRSDPEDSWGFFDPSVPTLADELHRAGYHTAIVGKWHLGLESPNLPNQRGFDLFHGFLGDMMDSYHTHLRHGINYLRKNANAIEADGHATDLFTTWAVDYLRNRARSPDVPFFLYLAYNAPHFPIEPPDDVLEDVRGRMPRLEHKRARNVALVEHLDSGVGGVLGALGETGLAENTLVFFTADNGGSLAHGQSNGRWRDGKQSHYEGGLRVPFLVRWPGRVAPGATSDAPGLIFDVFPTCLAAAGIERPAGIDAVSLLPAFDASLRTVGDSPDPDDGEREFYFVRREGGGHYGGKSYEAIIRGRWKLLQNEPSGRFELYDLVDDPLEQTDLASSHPEQLRILSSALRLHIQRGGRVPWQRPEDLPTMPEP